MKQLPPELIDGILTLAGIIFGWFARWLKGKSTETRMKKQVNNLMQTNNQLINKIKSRSR